MEISRAPRVSVLTAVHNAARFLDQTIASIVEQHYTDFEYILIDDASTDASPTILASWAARDARIRLLHNATALNPAGALNRGLSVARGEYVANLDHDDISYPTRLAEQVAYLDAHANVGLLGTQVETIDAEGVVGHAATYPTDPLLAQWRLLFQTPLLHSSVMMRRALLDQVGQYSTRMWLATDFDLFARLAQVTTITNLSTTHVAYRIFPEQLSQKHLPRQTGQVILFMLAQLAQRYSFDATSLPALKDLYGAIRGQMIERESSLLAVGALLARVHAAFVAGHDLSAAQKQLVDDDCARMFLRIAWRHRRVLRAASRTLLAHAIAIDPELWQKPVTWSRVRNLRRQEVARALETVTTPEHG